MIHVLTVHWKDDRWVDIQLAYLKRHLPAAFQVYAFLNFLPRDHRGKYFYSSTEPIASHAIKLNLLADMAALASSHHDDWLMFIDGDAFPVGDVVAYGEKNLPEHPLLAIQRTENDGDIQPHPSFCLTTIKLWKAIAGDWKEGYSWNDPTGAPVTDVGGNLLKILNDERIDWLPMRRSNMTNLHPLWFGLYEDVVYHHGAGFRTPMSRADSSRHRPGVSRWFPHPLRKLLRGMNECFGPMGKTLKRNHALSEEVFRSIVRDPIFYRRFQEPVGEPTSGTQGTTTKRSESSV